MIDFLFSQINFFITFDLTMMIILFFSLLLSFFFFLAENFPRTNQRINRNQRHHYTETQIWSVICVDTATCQALYGRRKTKPPIADCCKPETNLQCMR